MFSLPVSFNELNVEFDQGTTCIERETKTLALWMDIVWLWSGYRRGRVTISFC